MSETGGERPVQVFHLTPDIIGAAESGDITSQLIKDSLREFQRKKLIQITNEPRKVYAAIDSEGVISLNFPNGSTYADKLHEMVHAQQFLLAMASGRSPQSLRKLTPLQRGLGEMQATRIVKRYLDSGNGSQNDINANISTMRTWFGELPRLGYVIPEKIHNPYAITDETPYLRITEV